MFQGGFLFDNITNLTAFNYLGEPSLDLQYSMALAFPQDVILYQVCLYPLELQNNLCGFSFTLLGRRLRRTRQHLVSSATAVESLHAVLTFVLHSRFNNFLDAIDGSCKRNVPPRALIPC